MAFTGLYQFQEEDVTKLAHNSIGLIGNEMGTGKTHEAIALLHQWRTEVFQDSGQLLPVLIITPIDTFPSWETKLHEQLNHYTTYTIDRKNRPAFIESIERNEADIYICHWAALHMLAPEFLSRKIVFSMVIGDEVHAIANHKTKVAKALKSIKTYTKLGLSGTASGDKPWGLWSVLNWLDPKSWTSYWAFVRSYVEVETTKTFAGLSKEGYVKYNTYQKFIRARNIEKLHSRIDSYYIRHLKNTKCCAHHPNGVMSYLPEKVYERLYVELSPQQRRVYTEMESEMIAWLDSDEPLVAPVVIAQLIRLSQMCLANPVFNDGVLDLTMPSTKMEALKSVLTEYEDKAFVVFTSSKKMAYLTEQELNNSGISCAVLCGDTPKDIRHTLVSDFVDGKYRVFIGVIQAVAEGIDGLQLRTDTAIFLDRSWRTIKNMQAEDRLHRGGQQSSVTIIDIVAYNTIEDDRSEAVGKLTKLSRKWDRVQEILNVQS